MSPNFRNLCRTATGVRSNELARLSSDKFVNSVLKKTDGIVEKYHDLPVVIFLRGLFVYLLVFLTYLISSIVQEIRKYTLLFLKSQLYDHDRDTFSSRASSEAVKIDDFETATTVHFY